MITTRSHESARGDSKRRVTVWVRKPLCMKMRTTDRRGCSKRSPQWNTVESDGYITAWPAVGTWH